MAKRVLMVATVPSMIGQFNMNNIHSLLDMGYQVDIAVDFTDTNVWPTERIKRFKDELQLLGIETIQLDFSRSPLRLSRHLDSYKKVVKLIKNRKYFFIHTHTPIASAIVRLAAKKYRIADIKIIYTAHGFHFYYGAPLKNWILYYPVEKWLSRYTDVLITINREDYKRARERFKANKTVYIPGVGVDTERFTQRASGREKIRAELGLKDTDIMLLSVGELNKNKNHETVIRAVIGLNLTYVIVGKGERKDELEIIAQKCGVDLRLVGYRNDVADFYNTADVYVLPSIREGLNVSLMEAMASGLPVVCSKIRGNMDLIDGDGGALFNPHSVLYCTKAIKKVLCGDREKMGVYNIEKIRRFDISKVETIMNDVYTTLI